MTEPPEHESRKETAEEFLSRWSRRKREVRESPPAPAPARPAADEAPPLPALESLTPDSDFSGFLHPKVDDKLRRAALKKLFSDPHFNVMDGLDVYIDDYSKDDPIPEAMMKELRQAQDILKASRERREEEARRESQRRREAGLEPAEAGEAHLQTDTAAAAQPPALAEPAAATDLPAAPEAAPEVAAEVAPEFAPELKPIQRS
jgi:hypothetical protein